MEWNQDFAQKLFVFSFQWQRETIYDAAKNFQKFAYAVKMFGFIDEPKKVFFIKLAIQIYIIWEISIKSTKFD